MLRAVAPGTAAVSMHLKGSCGLPAEATGPGRCAHDARLQWAAPARAVPASVGTGPLACVALPRGGSDGFLCHPAAMDAGMHAGMLTGTPDGLLRIPGSIPHLGSLICFVVQKADHATLPGAAKPSGCASGALDALHAPTPGSARRASSWTAVSGGSSTAAADASRLTSHWLMPEEGSPATLTGLHTHVSRASLTSSVAGMHYSATPFECYCFTKAYVRKAALSL